MFTGSNGVRSCVRTRKTGIKKKRTNAIKDLRLLRRLCPTISCLRLICSKNVWTVHKYNRCDGNNWNLVVPPCASLSVKRRHSVDLKDLASFILVSPGVSCSEWPHAHWPGTQEHGTAVGEEWIHFMWWSRVPACCQAAAMTKLCVHRSCQPGCLNTGFLVYSPKGEK